MLKFMPKLWVVLVASVLVVTGARAESVPKDLPYLKPGTQGMTALDIMRQVYFVNHFYSFKNYSIKNQRKRRKRAAVVIMRAKEGRPTTFTVERFLNNDYDDGVVKAKDMAIFYSGKLRGTGLLVTDYVDDNRSQSYMIWLPALRKVRRFAQPAHDDAWGGSDFTFGDVTLRKPFNEIHELLREESFEECLGAMDIPDDQRNRDTRVLPYESCDQIGKDVHVIKSTTKFKDWWYDYRISYVDVKTYADYRTEYFKDGDMIKVIDRDWGSFVLSDPRAQFWRYWYGKDLRNGHETWAVVRTGGVRKNEKKLRSRFWSERTLRRIRR